MVPSQWNSPRGLLIQGWLDIIYIYIKYMYFDPYSMVTGSEDLSQWALVLQNNSTTWFQYRFLNKDQPSPTHPLAVFPLSRTVEGSISKDGLVAHFPRPAVRNLHRSGPMIQLVLKSLGKAMVKNPMVHGRSWKILTIKMAIVNILKDFGSMARRNV